MCKRQNNVTDKKNKKKLQNDQSFCLLEEKEEKVSIVMSVSLWLVTDQSAASSYLQRLAVKKKSANLRSRL